LVRIFTYPRLQNGTGGTSSFYRNFISQLSSDETPSTLSASNLVLLINATSNIFFLLKCLFTRKPIVQRLGTPINYVWKSRAPLLTRVRYTLGLALVAIIRRFVASSHIYQSIQVRDEWLTLHGSVEKPSTVIYNGVDLNLFTDNGPALKFQNFPVIASLEGSHGLERHNIALRLLNSLVASGYSPLLLLIGPVTETPESDLLLSSSMVRSLGKLDHSDIPTYLRSSHMMISTDIIAGCPNSVLESLSCGTPIIGYDYGVLSELAPPTVSSLVPPFHDPSTMNDPGNIDQLANAAIKIYNNQDYYRKNARVLALEKYSLGTMANKYLDFFSTYYSAH